MSDQNEKKLLDAFEISGLLHFGHGDTLAYVNVKYNGGKGYPDAVVVFPLGSDGRLKHVKFAAPNMLSNEKRTVGVLGAGDTMKLQVELGEHIYPREGSTINIHAKVVKGPNFVEEAFSVWPEHLDDVRNVEHVKIPISREKKLVKVNDRTSKTVNVGQASSSEIPQGLSSQEKLAIVLGLVFVIVVWLLIIIARDCHQADTSKEQSSICLALEKVEQGLISIWNMF